MLDFGEHATAAQTTCLYCHTTMQDMGTHDIPMGELSGAALSLLGRQLADDGEEAFEHQIKVQIFVGPQCHEVSFKYRGGL